jgi:tRNA A-37 threonylcarbamoyl transferase component Bud32
MNEPATCPECGKPLPEGSSHDLCPACLMGQVMASQTQNTMAGNEAAAPPSTPEEIADKFPQFEVVECLGRGGMGVVYKARQKSLDRWVAIKVLAPERVHEERFAEHFEREAKTLAKMSHPNIVTVFDHGQTDDLFYIVMEFVDGLNLRDLLREAKMEPEQALAIIPPICDALEYAHDKGVVHRDIKPENILLDREGRVKIADFGIASLVGASGEKSGTPPYMAPEQKEGIVDRRADIYALGAVLYEMLTGERPNKELVAPSKKVQIDVRLDEIVLRALEKTPELRYQTADEFRTVVETVVSNPRSPDTQKPVEFGSDSNRRFSRAAIVGACWLAFIPLHFLFPLIVPPDWKGNALIELLAMLQALLFWTVPLGATILGWIAVSQIRRSAGNLYGLWLAVFDGLLFPLLALDAFILAIPFVITKLLPLKFLFLVPPLLIVVVSLDILIVRRVWRAVNRNDSTAPNQTGTTDKPTRFSRKAILVAAYVCMALSLTVLFTKRWNERKREGVWTPARISDTITQQYGDAQVRVVDISQTGQVVLVSFVCEMFRPDHELMVLYNGPALSYPNDLASSVKAKAKDLDCLITSRAKLVGDNIGEVLAGTNVLSDRTMFRVGFVLPDTETAAQVVKEVQEVHLGKPRGLGEGGSVLLLFSLRRDFGKDAAGKPVVEALDATLWSRPQSATTASQTKAQTVFGLQPVIELILPMNEGGETDMLDPETGQKGLLIQHNAKADKTVLVGMNGVMTQESRADQWAEITNFQALETLKNNFMSKGGSVGAVVNGPAPHTFLFKTGNGRIGILQITRFIENPRGVEVRYKMVQPSRFIRWTGTFSLDDAGSIVLTPSSDGKVSLAVTMVKGTSRDTCTVPDFCKQEGWFVYVESFKRVWIFDGIRQLDLLTPGGRDNVGDPSIRALCPAAVWDALPESARKFYQEPHSKEINGDTGKSPEPSFGPVMERVVMAYEENPAQACLDFGSGEFRSPPAAIAGRIQLASDIKAPGDERYDWFKSSGVDLIGSRAVDGSVSFKFMGQPPSYQIRNPQAKSSRTCNCLHGRQEPNLTCRTFAPKSSIRKRD